ncbi:hypothetical protein WJX74_009685 [Apatococcus lobatus]|uniref:Uncharacterized protein n=1 Tax=Apatococcus lobatus TaxID=904363 RepID=A0AAW1RFP4_9CHLO
MGGQVWLTALGVSLLTLLGLLLRPWHSVTIPPSVQPAPLNRTGDGIRFKYDSSCDMQLNAGGWVGISHVSCEPSTKGVATCGPGHSDNWQWSAAAVKCGAQRTTRSQLQGALRNRWVVVAGDSITRFFYAALLRALTDDESQQVVFGHQDFEHDLDDNVRLTFRWAPYAENLTHILQAWTAHSEAPTSVVMSAGLWHMLHITDALGYQQTLGNLKSAASRFMSAQPSSRQPYLSLFSISEVYPPKFKTEEKRAHMTLGEVDAYNRAIMNSSVLVPSGPLHLLDMHHLTQGCGPACTHDGLHYSNATYDAAMQIWANHLLLSLSQETSRKLMLG